MRKIIFILTIFVSFFLLSSIVSAQPRLISLDIISIINSFLKAWGIIPTAVTTPTAVTSEKTIPSSGSIVYPNAIITIDSGNEIGTNNLLLGFMLDGFDWEPWLTNSIIRQPSIDAKFKMVRLFDFKTSSPKWCTSWNTQTKKCNNPDWTSFDNLVETIKRMGAEPMITLGGAAGTSFPPVSEGQGLPDPAQYGAYASEWVNHFKSKVKYYEIVNEPNTYFIVNNVIDDSRVEAFTNFYKRVSKQMRDTAGSLNPSIQLIISTDGIHFGKIHDSFIRLGATVDSINFHKYDRCTSNPSDTLDSHFFIDAETYLWDSHVQATRQVYPDLPVINSESNMCGKSEQFDKRMLKMEGAVWNAMVLRYEALNGIDYSIIYKYGSDTFSYALINLTSPYNKYYPYFVYNWIGNNLAVSDKIVESISSSGNIRSLAWIHERKLNILLIHNSTATETIYLQGISGQFQKTFIDNTIPYTQAREQTGNFNAPGTITFNGYTVMLLQSIYQNY
jgi:hypothetical protein